MGLKASTLKSEFQQSLILAEGLQAPLAYITVCYSN